MIDTVYLEFRVMENPLGYGHPTGVPKLSHGVLWDDDSPTL